MDAFELDVSQGRADERRRFFVVEKFLEIIQTAHQLVGRRRYEQGVAGPSAADPVLRRPKLAGLLAAAAPLAEEDVVNLLALGRAGIGTSTNQSPLPKSKKLVTLRDAAL